MNVQLRKATAPKPAPTPAPAPWIPVVDRAPSLPPAIQIYAEQVSWLGEKAGRRWFVLSGDATATEYELSGERPIRDANPNIRLEDGRIYLGETVEAVDTHPLTGEVRRFPDLLWLPARKHPAGTFDGTAPSKPAATPRKPTKPLAAVDGLSALPALAARQGTILAIGEDREETIAPIAPGTEPFAVPDRHGPRARFIDGRGPVRGADAILEVLRRDAGVTLAPCRYGCHIITSTPGGGLVVAGRDLIDKVAPFLAPMIGCTRSPLADVVANAHCHHPDHAEDDVPTAVTIGPGAVYGAPLCAEHVR